jgi:hypothetical protein
LNLRTARLKKRGCYSTVQNQGPGFRRQLATLGVVAAFCDPTARCLCVIALFLGGCTYWEPILPPVPSADLPSSLRISLDSGPPLLLVEPYVRTDTLFGRVASDTVELPVEQLHGIERQRIHVLRTLGLIAGVSAFWITVAYYSQ